MISGCTRSSAVGTGGCKLQRGPIDQSSTEFNATSEYEVSCASQFKGNIMVFPPINTVYSSEIP